MQILSSRINVIFPIDIVMEKWKFSQLPGKKLIDLIALLAYVLAAQSKQFMLDCIINVLCVIVIVFPDIMLSERKIWFTFVNKSMA